MFSLPLVSQFSLDPSLGQGYRLHPDGLMFHLLHPGGLRSRLLHPGGLQSRLLRPGGLQSRLLRPGGLQSRLLRPGGLQSHLLFPGGLHACSVVVICCSVCYVVGVLCSVVVVCCLALVVVCSAVVICCSDCSVMVLVCCLALVVFCSAVVVLSLGGSSVTNPVRGFPADCHQRSLSLLIDSHTTLPITSRWTPFPIILARTHHRLQSPVSHHLISTHTINTTHTQGSQGWLLTLVSMFLSFAFLVFWSLDCCLVFHLLRSFGGTCCWVPISLSRSLSRCNMLLC